jgi:hypothetical protein
MTLFLIFLLFSSVILLLPININLGRFVYISYWACLITVFAIATQEFGYDTKAYANFVESNLNEPFSFSFPYYVANDILVAVGKITHGYNEYFSAIIIFLCLVPLIFLHTTYSLSFAVTILPTVIFFALGNYKLGLCLPLIYSYFICLENNNLRKASIFLFFAIIMHPQNVILVLILPLILCESEVKKKLTLTFASLVIIGVTGLFILGNLNSLDLFTRYFVENQFSEGGVNGVSQLKLAEAIFQIFFLYLLYLGRHHFSSINAIYISCVAYHVIRLFFSVFPVVSEYLIGRGLLPFLILDVILLERCYRQRNLSYKIIYSFQILSCLRLVGTFWSGSLRNAIDVHLI